MHTYSSEITETPRGEYRLTITRDDGQERCIRVYPEMSDAVRAAKTPAATIRGLSADTHEYRGPRTFA